MIEQIIDCIVIGAGPGGLTAAIYLKRFRLNTIIVGNAQSRASLIPRSYNYPGFPQGVTGQELLHALQKQLARYDTTVVEDTIYNIKKKGPHFEVIGKTFHCIAKKIILATGVIDIEPSLPNLKHAVRNGLIKHCSICDAYEAIDHNIGVIGIGNKGIKEAFFLRTYSSQVTLLTLGDTTQISGKKRADLASAGIKLIQDPVDEVVLNETGISSLITQNGNQYQFDILYSVLDCVVRSQLALQLGAKNINHYLLVNHYQETSVPGLFAIGDIVLGLSQISVATGQAAVAATQINSDIRKMR